MDQGLSRNHKTRTLWLAGALHAFTHMYNVALLPLYLLIQKDFQLDGIGKATLLVTLMMLAYFGPSYFMGILADRVNRKRLLGWGLAINGLGFVCLAFSPNYSCALASVILAGLGGGFYHPAASAMIARLCPTAIGKAFGLVGIGSSVGFFLGPLYTGWRAETAGWRAPVLELGIFGILGAILFAWLAEDTSANLPKKSSHPETMFPTPILWFLFLGACVAFSLRDFAGSSMGSLGSLFLQRAHGFNITATGFTLSGIFVASAISNPLFGGLSDRGRIRWLCLVLSIATLGIMIFPHLSRPLLMPVYIVYGFFFMASYPMVEAGLMQSVPDQVRGRVMGLFITFGGIIGNLAHWFVGHWVENLGSRADTPAGFFNLYTTMGILMVLSFLGLPCLHAIRRREHLEVGRGVPAEPPPSTIQFNDSTI